MSECDVTPEGEKLLKELFKPTECLVKDCGCKVVLVGEAKTPKMDILPCPKHALVDEMVQAIRGIAGEIEMYDSLINPAKMKKGLKALLDKIEVKP